MKKTIKVVLTPNEVTKILGLHVIKESKLDASVGYGIDLDVQINRRTYNIEQISVGLTPDDERVK